LNHDSEEGLARLPADEFVRAVSTFNGKVMGNERSDFDFLLGK